MIKLSFEIYGNFESRTAEACEDMGHIDCSSLARIALAYFLDYHEQRIREVRSDAREGTAKAFKMPDVSFDIPEPNARSLPARSYYSGALGNVTDGSVENRS